MSHWSERDMYNAKKVEKCFQLPTPSKAYCLTCKIVYNNTHHTRVNICVLHLLLLIVSWIIQYSDYSIYFIVGGEWRWGDESKAVDDRIWRVNWHVDSRYVRYVTDTIIIAI